MAIARCMVRKKLYLPTPGIKTLLTPGVRIVVASNSSVANFPTASFHDQNTAPHHCPEFKEQALLKARHRGTRSVISIADESSMADGTLRKWLSASNKISRTASPVLVATAALDGPASDWTSAQHLMVLQQTLCTRRHGPGRLVPRAWHVRASTDAVAPGVLHPPPCLPHARPPGEFRELQRQQEQLQHQLRRKDKAVAEVAALLVPQKTSRRC